MLLASCFSSKKKTSKKILLYQKNYLYLQNQLIYYNKTF